MEIKTNKDNYKELLLLYNIRKSIKLSCNFPRLRIISQNKQLLIDVYEYYVIRATTTSVAKLSVDRNVYDGKFLVEHWTLSKWTSSRCDLKIDGSKYILSGLTLFAYTR